MKSKQEIKKLAERTDWGIVARLAGCCAKNVKLVINDERPDNFNIQKIFSDLLINRTSMDKRYTKKRKKTRAGV